MKLILNELQDIPVNASISLYGAGEIGISLFRMLQERRPDVEIICFVDTYKKGDLYGIEIIHPDELDNEKTNFDFIVITSHTYQDHIQAILEQKGIHNYRFLNPIFNSQETPPTTSHSPIDKLSCAETLYAFYDRAVAPDGFDVATFLYLAETERIKRGCKHLHPVFVPRPADFFIEKSENLTYGKNDPSVTEKDEETSRWGERNVMVPCCWMLQSCRQVTVCTSRVEASLIEKHFATNSFPNDYTVEHPTPSYSWAKLIEATLGKTDLPTFRATAKAKDYVSMWIKSHIPEQKKIVTITLRESPFHADRNSNVKVWVEFAAKIDRTKYWPIFLRDTSVALDKPPAELDEFTIFQESSWNIELRMAIYELSYINLLTAGGPAMMALYNKKTRLVMFHVLRKSVFECSKDAIEADGLTVGGDMPGATHLQKSVWEDESFDLINREFEKLCSKIDQ